MQATQSRLEVPADRLLSQQGLLSDARKITRSARGLGAFVKTNSIFSDPGQSIKFLAPVKELRAAKGQKNPRYVPSVEDLDPVSKAMRAIPNRLFRAGANENFARGRQARLTRLFPIGHLDFEATADKVMQITGSGRVNTVHANQTPLERRAKDRQPSLIKDRWAKMTETELGDEFFVRPGKYLWKTSNFQDKTPSGAASNSQSFTYAQQIETAELNALKNRQLLRPRNPFGATGQFSRTPRQSVRNDQLGDFQPDFGMGTPNDPDLNEEGTVNMDQSGSDTYTPSDNNQDSGLKRPHHFMDPDEWDKRFGRTNVDLSTVHQPGHKRRKYDQHGDHRDTDKELAINSRHVENPGTHTLHLAEGVIKSTGDLLSAPGKLVGGTIEKGLGTVGGWLGLGHGLKNRGQKDIDESIEIGVDFGNGLLQAGDMLFQIGPKQNKDLRTIANSKSGSDESNAAWNRTIDRIFLIGTLGAGGVAGA